MKRFDQCALNRIVAMSDKETALVKRTTTTVAVPSGQSGARKPTRKALVEEEFTDVSEAAI